jgi:hypothetical protein
VRKGDLMSIHRASAGQRRTAGQQLVRELRKQLIRVQATVARQQLVIAAQERDLIDRELVSSAKEWNSFVARYHAATDPVGLTAAVQQQRGNRDARGRFISKQ